MSIAVANDVVTQAIDRIASGQDLSVEEAAAVLREIMEGRVTEVQTAAFLIALRTKGEWEASQKLARLYSKLAPPGR